MSKLVVLTRNLMDATRVQSIAPGAVVASSTGTEALADADLILLDLSGGFDPAQVAAIGPPVVAYGPHVDVTALEDALEAGCREALPRSRLFRRLPDLIG